MRQIKQRVTVHCELRPLERDGVAGYVAHRLQTAGTTPDQVRLTDEALDLVHAASGGVPRVINLVCDRALTHGQFARTSRIGLDLIRVALTDLRMAVPPLAAAAAPPVAVAPTREPAPVREPEPPPVAAPPAATPPVSVAPVAVPAVIAVPAAPASASGAALSSLLDLPAVDLKVNFEE